jgi:endonuclease YncB( thermonuclease family)
MDYLIEVYDVEGRRVGAYDDVPLIEAVRSMPGDKDLVQGLLPEGAKDIGHGYCLRVSVGGKLFCKAYVTSVNPQWSDTRKLILEKYVTFQNILEFEAEWSAEDLNSEVSGALVNRSVSSIVKEAINKAEGEIHYRVAHDAYPDGACREYSKFMLRKTSDNALERGGISSGQWVGGSRIDLSKAYAKDGDTISGLAVDGVAWPDLRMLMIDCEETSLNSHTYSRHPETESWSAERYAASGYKLKAEAAKAFLQKLIDEKGIDYIELNPHRNSSGAYDDRIDAYGRYIGLAFGGGECFNAALIEQSLADVYLYKNGAYHDPSMALKDFFSYMGVNADSIEAADETLSAYDLSGGVMEALTVMAYAADGFIWDIDSEGVTRFRKAARADHVVFFSPTLMGVRLGSDSSGIVNLLYVDGNPIASDVSESYYCGESMDTYGVHTGNLDCYAISTAEDAAKLGRGALRDLAYPEPSGNVVFFEGNDFIRVGDIVELRGEPLRRFERVVAGEWGDRFVGKLVGRVRKVSHRFTGKRVSTTVWLTSPLRSTTSPLSYMVKDQESATSLYQFRLDEESIGLDMGYHLD